MYSQSKCSNWAAYDPYLGEIGQIRDDQEPTAEVDVKATAEDIAGSGKSLNSEFFVFLGMIT